MHGPDRFRTAPGHAYPAQTRHSEQSAHPREQTASILGKTSFPSMENSPSETPKPSQSSPRNAEIDAALFNAGLQKVVIQSSRRREEHPGLALDARRFELPRSKSFTIESPSNDLGVRYTANSPVPSPLPVAEYRIAEGATYSPSIRPAPLLQLHAGLHTAAHLATGNQIIYRQFDPAPAPIAYQAGANPGPQDPNLPLRVPSTSPIRIQSGNPVQYLAHAVAVQKPAEPATVQQQAPGLADMQQATKSLSKENVELVIKNGLLSHKNKQLEDQVAGLLKEAEEKEKHFDLTFAQMKDQVAQLQASNKRMIDEDKRRKVVVDETKSVQTQVIEVVDSIESKLKKLKQTEAELSEFRDIANTAVKELEEEQARRKAAEKELEELRAELQQAKKLAQPKPGRQEQASHDTKKLESKPAEPGHGQLQSTKPRTNIDFFGTNPDSEEKGPKVNEYNPYDDDLESDSKTQALEHKHHRETSDAKKAFALNPLAYDSMLHDKKHDGASTANRKNNELMSMVDNGTETSYYAQFECPQFDLAPKRKLPNEDSMVVPVNPRTLDGDESSCFIPEHDKSKADKTHPNKVESMSHSSALIGSRFQDLEKMKHELQLLKKRNEELNEENESLKRELIRFPDTNADAPHADTQQRSSEKDKLSFNIDSKLRFVPITENPDSNRQGSSDERRENDLKTGMYSIYSFKPSAEDQKERDKATSRAQEELARSNDRQDKPDPTKISFLAHFGTATQKSDSNSKAQAQETNSRAGTNAREMGGWPNIFSQNGDRKTGSEVYGSSHLHENESLSHKDNLSIFTVGVDRRREPEELKNQIAISFTKDYSSAREAATPDKDSHDEDLVEPKPSHRASRDPRPSRSGKKANSFSEREGIAARNNSLENRKENSEPFFAEKEHEQATFSPLGHKKLQELLEHGNKEIALLREQVERANSKLDSLYEENVKLREKLHKKDADLVKMATYLRDHEREKKSLHKEIERMSERLDEANDCSKDSVDKEEYRKLIRDCLDA